MSGPPTSDLHPHKAKREGEKKMSSANITFFLRGDSRTMTSPQHEKAGGIWRNTKRMGGGGKTNNAETRVEGACALCSPLYAYRHLRVVFGACHTHTHTYTRTHTHTHAHTHTLTHTHLMHINESVCLKESSKCVHIYTRASAYRCTRSTCIQIQHTYTF